MRCDLQYIIRVRTLFSKIHAEAFGPKKNNKITEKNYNNPNIESKHFTVLSLSDNKIQLDLKK